MFEQAERYYPAVKPGKNDQLYGDFKFAPDTTKRYMLSY